MFFFMLCAILLVVGIVLATVPFFVIFRPTTRKGLRGNTKAIGIGLMKAFRPALGWGCIILAIVLAILNGGCVVCTRYSNDMDFEKKVLVREALVELMEDTSSDYKDSVYQAIVEFNTEVTDNQVKQENFWTACEYSNKYDWDSIELITPKGEYDK